VIELDDVRYAAALLGEVWNKDTLRMHLELRLEFVRPRFLALLSSAMSHDALHGLVGIVDRSIGPFKRAADHRFAAISSLFYQHASKLSLPLLGPGNHTIRSCEPGNADAQIRLYRSVGTQDLYFDALTDYLWAYLDRYEGVTIMPAFLGMLHGWPSSKELEYFALLRTHEKAANVFLEYVKFAGRQVLI